MKADIVHVAVMGRSYVKKLARICLAAMAHELASCVVVVIKRLVQIRKHGYPSFVCSATIRRTTKQAQSVVAPPESHLTIVYSSPAARSDIRDGQSSIVGIKKCLVSAISNPIERKTSYRWRRQSPRQLIQAIALLELRLVGKFQVIGLYTPLAHQAG